MKIYLVEDEIMLCESIARYLKKLGHHVRSSFDASGVVEHLRSEKFDMLIFDINLPDKNGLELLEELQHYVYIPTIFISALTDIKDISRAFELGAKDYIKKPFHLKELEIRIEKISQSMEDRKHIILSKNYSYSFEKKTLYFDGKSVTLSKRQIEIVELLARHRGIVVTYDIFREYVYTEAFVDNPTIRAEISRLKKAFKEDFIVNIRGVGYKIER
ncbi:MAG TPA: response regulator transcription factor [Nitratifractor sp.]|jgi:DNA-binding response OmpR family regulator|nr:response regulator transcription factor [Nitratifractor sp.]